MSKIVHVGDQHYKLKVQSGGEIRLDTGDNAGTVVITGNLDVLGTYTTIESTVTTITDPVITLNQGDTGTGVSFNFSGIEINRGYTVAHDTNSPAMPFARFFYDETVTHFNPDSGLDEYGTFTLTLDTNDLVGLKTNSITTGGSNLAFDLANSTSALIVVNASGNYEDNISDDDHIPNIKWVKDYLTGGATGIDTIYSDDTSVKAFDFDAGATSSRVEVRINNILKAAFRTGYTEFGNLRFNQTYGSSITNNSLTDNLKIIASANGNIEINGVLNLVNQATPVAVSGATKLYASTSGVAGGDTGVYVVNSTVSDELVSRNRALLFSILF
jgi:hypothetical protein